MILHRVVISLGSFCEMQVLYHRNIMPSPSNMDFVKLILVLSCNVIRRVAVIGFLMKGISIVFVLDSMKSYLLQRHVPKVVLYMAFGFTQLLYTHAAWFFKPRNEFVCMKFHFIIIGSLFLSQRTCY